MFQHSGDPYGEAKKVIKRILYTSILAAQFLTIGALRADDPFPCPDCDPGSGQGPELALLRADDPFPCPDCDPGSGQGPELTLIKS